jgi:hypothetical protein
VDPTELGLGDPAKLLDPKSGVSQLLTEMQNPRSEGQERVNGEVLDKIAGTVPGTAVTSFFSDAAPSTPVQLTFGIDPTSHQVRQVSAVGPFASATTASTYLLTLTDYSEHVTITAPS